MRVLFGAASLNMGSLDADISFHPAFDGEMGLGKNVRKTYPGTGHNDRWFHCSVGALNSWKPDPNIHVSSVDGRLVILHTVLRKACRSISGAPEPLGP